MWTFVLIRLTINLLALWYWVWCDRAVKFLKREPTKASEIKASKETVWCISMIFPLLPMRDMFLDALKNRK